MTHFIYGGTKSLFCIFWKPGTMLTGAWEAKTTLIALFCLNMMSTQKKLHSGRLL